MLCRRLRIGIFRGSFRSAAGLRCSDDLDVWISRPILDRGQVAATLDAGQIQGAIREARPGYFLLVGFKSSQFHEVI